MINLQEKGEETFEELQDLFEELFQGNDDTFGSSSQTTTGETSSSNNKRNSSEMNFGNSDLEGNLNFQNFCIGVSTLFMWLMDSFLFFLDPFMSCEN